MADRLKDRIALITGASRGIGAAVAAAGRLDGVVDLLQAADGARHQDAMSPLGRVGGSATLVPLDLTEFDAIDVMGAEIYQRWGRLDVLVGNAAMLGQLSPMGHIPPKVWERAFALNVTANWRLIRSLDPLLRQSAAGRAIFVTSGATQSLPPYWGVYSTTKAALEAMVKTYAREVERTRMRVNLVNPGPTRTGMRAQAFPGEDPDDLPPPEHVTETMIRLAEPSFTGNGLWVAADRPPPSPSGVAH